MQRDSFVKRNIVWIAINMLCYYSSESANFGFAEIEQ